MVRMRPVPVEGADRSDEFPLALRFRPGLGGLPTGLETLLEMIAVGRVAPDLMVIAHRLAPVGHAAAGVFLLEVLERRRRVLVGEGVKQGHAALKGLLNRRRARDGE